MATCPSILAREIPWTKGTWWATAHGVAESGTTEQLSSSMRVRGLGVAALRYMRVKSEPEVFLQQKKDDQFPREAFGVIYLSLCCRPRRQSISLSFLAVTVLGAHGEFLHRVGPYPVICSGSLVFCML